MLHLASLWLQLPPWSLPVLKKRNDGSVSTGSRGTNRVHVSWKEDKLAVLLRDDAIWNVLYGVGGAAGEMTALYIGLGDDLYRFTVTLANTYIDSIGTTSTTAWGD